MQEERECIDNGQSDYSNFAFPARYSQKCYAQAEIMEDVDISYGSDSLKLRFQPYEGRRQAGGAAKAGSGQQKPSNFLEDNARAKQA